MAVAKPGLNVNIIFTLDIEKETADVRGAIIYDINGIDIILSQTNPPIMERHIGKDISVTYLIREKYVGSEQLSPFQCGETDGLGICEASIPEYG